MSNWVASCVLARAGLEERVEAYTHMRQLAQEAHRLRREAAPDLADERFG